MKGDQGANGRFGEKGAPGVNLTLTVEQPGPPGPKGETGNPGSIGTSGTKGNVGITGDLGSKGDKGTTGVEVGVLSLLICSLSPYCYVLSKRVQKETKEM